MELHTVLSVLGLVLALAAMALAVAGLRSGRPSKESRCKVDEETGGLFIGRKYCATHNERWDDGGPCPATRVPQPPYELQPWTVVPFKLPNGEVLEMAIMNIEYIFAGGTSLTMQDVESLQRQHSWPGA